MKTRCYNPNHMHYARYGGRGITVCDEWRTSFSAFLLSVGPRPSTKHSLDRINNDGNYEPGNVRWADDFEQLNNTRQNRRITIDGRTANLAQWVREAGLDYRTVLGRLRRGWDHREAVTTPTGTKCMRDHFVTYNGRTQRVAAWAAELGVDGNTLGTRLQRGWTVEHAIEHPVGRWPRRSVA